jgi:molybdate transport system substrate-binding protein
MHRSLLLAATLLFAGSCDRGEDATLVAAAMSLRHAMLDLGEAYEERNQGVSLRFHFAASGVLLQQASQGAPFDVVVFAGEEEMGRLAASGDIDIATRQVFATNRMVVAVPRGGRSLEGLEELRSPDYERIALGSPAMVPAGRYAAQVLQRSGLWNELEPRFLLAIDAAQVVEYVERDEVDAAFLYRSDSVAFPWLTVALTVDSSLHEPIRYTAALVRDPPDPAGGRRFLQLLEGSLGQVVLRRHGFGPPPDPAP